MGSAYHHWRRYQLDADDVCHAVEAHAIPCRLRGSVETSPHFQANDIPDPLRSIPARPTTHFALRAVQRQDLAQRVWLPASGLVQVRVVGRRTDFRVGDTLELLGRLDVPDGPANPGEPDYAAFLRDQGIGSVLTVVDADEIELRDHGWPLSLFGLLALVRGWGERMLEQTLPAEQQSLAAALLLGDDAAMSRDEWDLYQRTGVIHVVAISGQHLMVLGWFLWLLARRCYMRRRWAAPLVALVLLAYALLSGARPPVMRAAWMVIAWSLAILLRRPVQPANLFALGWIGVLIWNPTDIFSNGCQLSFLAVAILLWGTGRWQNAEPDPLQREIDASRPWLLQCVVTFGREVRWAYAVNIAVWLAVTPLIAARYHLVAPVALLLGPPVALLASLGLLAGFGLLLVAPWAGPLAWPFALATWACLAGGDLLVRFADKLPAVYAADVPQWWLWVFYVGLLLGLATRLRRHTFRLCLAAALAWLGLGLILQLWPHYPGEFRCTFLAVGHGGCTVIETPGGRVLLYDAGAISGPEVTRRQIAPFLWQRGIRRIDEVILSHGDLDHYNGLRGLIERFAIARATATPSVVSGDAERVAYMLKLFDDSRIPLRAVHASQSWLVEDVSFTVLHPPAEGPAGNENARSLVLLVAHRGLRLLLTGDLEGPGLTQVLQMPAPPIEVLMAPHHGSERSEPARLAEWARPLCAVSSQSKPRTTQRTASHYVRHGAEYLATWPHGAITVRQRGEDAWVETYHSGMHRVLR
jgi:competence protein ComEC